jgi:hydrogenase maturation protease
MSDVKVIGIGSPFGHDSLGWQVIDHLRRQYSQNKLRPERINLIETDRPGINLIQLMQGAKAVILVDAILDDHRHGETIQLNKSQLIRQQDTLSSHNLDVASAIALAEKLQLLPETVMIFGLGIDPAREDAINETAVQKLTDAIVGELEVYFSPLTTA